MTNKEGSSVPAEDGRSSQKRLEVLISEEHLGGEARRLIDQFMVTFREIPEFTEALTGAYCDGDNERTLDHPIQFEHNYQTYEVKYCSYDYTSWQLHIIKTPTLFIRPPHYLEEVTLRAGSQKGKGPDWGRIAYGKKPLHDERFNRDNLFIDTKTAIKRVKEFLQELQTAGSV